MAYFSGNIDCDFVRSACCLFNHFHPNQIEKTEKKVKVITQQFKDARHHYSEVIHQQFNDWNLSQSEQEVAMLMLKGLNFQEIATIRNTKEKTCRQQASAIYTKSGLVGRHELSAWFIEDFISDSNTSQ